MKQENKKAFREIDNGTMQDITREFISRHVYCCQSGLVSHLFEKQVFDFEDYVNFYKTDAMLKYEYDVTTPEEIEELRDNGEDIQEVFEHWVCSEWLTDKLEEQGEPILKTDYESWWGRTATGQAIYLDYNIQELAYKYSYDKRLYNEEVA